VKRLFLASALLSLLACDSTEPSVAGSVSFTYTGAGGGTFTAAGDAPSFTAPSTSTSWAVGYTDAGETYVVASRPRTGGLVDLAILRIERTTAGTEPIDPACDVDGSSACSGLWFSLNFNGNGDTGDFFCFLSSGTVVVTDISANRIKGTFSGSGSCGTGAGGTPGAFTVTGGTFDVARVAAPAD
jgi:hypothetical protein